MRTTLLVAVIYLALTLVTFSERQAIFAQATPQASPDVQASASDGNWSVNISCAVANDGAMGWVYVFPLELKTARFTQNTTSPAPRDR